MDWGNFGWSEGLAALALPVSIISWISAKASADAAKQANALQMHSYRENLYVAFYDLSGRFDFEREHIDFDHVFAFQRQSKTCFLYVSPQLAEQMMVFHMKVLRITDKQRYLVDVQKRIETTKGDPYLEDQRQSAIAEAHNLWLEIQGLVDEAIPMGKTVLASLGDEIRIPIPKSSPLKRKKPL